MWPLIMQFMRSNAAYITLPIATLVGVIGYNIESLLSDKYTPYSRKIETLLNTYMNFSMMQILMLNLQIPFSASIQEKRAERITDDERLKAATDVEKLVYKENVLGRNLSPSLEKGK